MTSRSPLAIARSVSRSVSFIASSLCENGNRATPGARQLFGKLGGNTQLYAGHGFEDEIDVGEHPAAARPHLDVIPRDEKRRMTGAKQEQDAEVETARVRANG